MLPKHNIVRFCIPVLLIAIILSGCIRRNKQAQMDFDSSMLTFSQSVLEENIDGITLTIYRKGHIYTPVSDTAESLISRSEKSYPENIFILDGQALGKQADLLRRFSNENFVVADDEDAVMDIYQCFVFESVNQEKLMEIAVGGWSAKDIESVAEGNDIKYSGLSQKYIYINGFAVEYTDTIEEILNTLYQEARNNSKDKL